MEGPPSENKLEVIPNPEAGKIAIAHDVFDTIWKETMDRYGGLSPDVRQMRIEKAANLIAAMEELGLVSYHPDGQKGIETLKNRLNEMLLQK